MSVGLGIGSGFAQGLAKVLLGKRQRDQEEAFQRENRHVQIKLSLLPEILKRAADYSDVEPFITDLLNPGGKKPKKGEPDVNGILSQFLAPAMGTAAAPAAMPQSTPREEVAGVEGRIFGEPAPLPSRAAVTPAVPRQTLLGVPLLSETEMAERDARRIGVETTAKIEADWQAKTALLNRMVAQGVSRQQAMRALGMIPEPRVTVAPAGSAVITDGEVTHAQPAKVDPVNWQRIEGVIEGEDPSKRRVFFVNPETREITEQDGTKVTGRVLDVTREVDPSLVEARELRNVLLRMQTTAGGLTPAQLINEQQQLREAWQKHIQPIIERQEAVARIDTAMTQLQSGRPASRLAAVDAILVAFQKLNDERTGVREGEVQRIMDGLGLPSRISGALTRLQKDGASIPDAQLLELANLAKNTAAEMDRVRNAELTNYRSSIEETIRPFGIPATRIFGRSTIGQAAGDGNTPDAAKRTRARQVLLQQGKQADDATIDQFLRNNPTFQ